MVDKNLKIQTKIGIIEQIIEFNNTNTMHYNIQYQKFNRKYSNKHCIIKNFE